MFVWTVWLRTSAMAQCNTSLPILDSVYYYSDVNYKERIKNEVSNMGDLLRSMREGTTGRHGGAKHYVKNLTRRVESIIAFIAKYERQVAENNEASAYQAHAILSEKHALTSSMVQQNSVMMGILSENDNLKKFITELRTENDNAMVAMERLQSAFMWLMENRINDLFDTSPIVHKMIKND